MRSSSDTEFRLLRRLSLRLDFIVRTDFLPLTAVQLAWRPSEDRWSVGECLLHLSLFLEEYLPLVERTAAGLKPVGPFRPQPLSCLGRWYVQGVKIQDNNELRKALQSAPRHWPQGDLAGSVRRFLALHERLLSVLERAEQASPRGLKVGLACWGLLRLPLADALAWLVYHNERHVVQAQRVRVSDGFVGSGG
jgi:hypothetical protein